MDGAKPNLVHFMMVFFTGFIDGSKQHRRLDNLFYQQLIKINDSFDKRIAVWGSRDGSSAAF